MEAKSIQLNICYACMKSMPEGSSVCPVCGNDNGAQSNLENTLPEGTVLFRKYLVGKVVGRGGFGITYIGYDLDLQLKVAIKEYFPAGVSIRSSGSYDVISDASTSQDHSAFSKGCEAFLDEARMLASVNSPYIVHVRDFFREHGTAYIVMDYVEGITLTKVLQKAGGRIEAERVVSLMLPLIEQLDKLHEKNIIHRDIKPENIMLVKDWFGVHLILLDFGAARSFISGNVSKTFTAVVTPGFAPPEQYSQKSRQGAFTDVYGICATMYYAITGTIPPTATERSAEDIPIRSFRSFGLDVPQHIERAIIHGLALKSAERTQTMQELYAELSGDAPILNSQQSRQETTNRTPSHHAASRSASHVRQKSDNTGGAEGRTPKKSGGSKIAAVLLAMFIVVFAGASIMYLLSPQNKLPSNNAKFQNSSGTSLADTNDERGEESDYSDPGGYKNENTSEYIEINELTDNSIGKYVTFGSYEQDNDLTDGTEPIEWLILDVQDTRALLVSKYALDSHQFNDKTGQTVQWGSSSLREWLNSISFLDNIFTVEEKNRIVVNVVGNDYLFLLSDLEAEQYFASDEARKCEPTAYCRAHGVYCDNDGKCVWWLRTSVGYNNHAHSVTSYGAINRTGVTEYYDNIAVRPAVWIVLDETQAGESVPTSSTTTESENNQGKSLENINSSPKTVNVDDYVFWGSYEQDNDLTNGKEPIEWLVLDVQSDRALLISKYALTCRNYNAYQTASVTWETCSLRQWLNEFFLNDAFDSQEQKDILLSTVKADKHPKYNTNPGNDTKDHVFILGVSEVDKYFGNKGDARCTGTDFCYSQRDESADGEECQWWTRTPGANPAAVVFVSQYGQYINNGDNAHYVHNVNCVRPAMWVRLDAINN